MHFEVKSYQRDETMEHSQLVSDPETRNINVTIQNFTNESNTGEAGHNQPSALPYRSQHFTQVRIKYNRIISSSSLCKNNHLFGWLGLVGLEIFLCSSEFKDMFQ